MLPLLFFLGLTLGEDKDGLGTPVKTILENGTISRDGSIKLNDRIISINGENLRKCNVFSSKVRLLHFSLFFGIHFHDTFNPKVISSTDSP